MLTTAAYAAVSTGRLSSAAPKVGEAAASDSCLFISTADGALTVVPVAYIERQSQPSEGRLTLNLINGKRLSFKDVTGCTGTPPEDMPAFTSFKFNNKFNPQLYCDVEAADPSASLIRLEAGGIGKWLTASFQLPDDDTQVFVGTTPQQSKVTRQSFARPVTYTLGRALWKEVQILQDSTGYTYNEIPYGRHQTVAVDFPSDYPIGTYGIPQIHITTETGEPPLSKTEYIEGMAEFYGAGVFPDMGEKRILIRGRGNSSWSDSGATAKNPYHFKFLEKEKPFGLTAGKHWVLLANRQSGSMTANAIGMYISGLMQTAAANHIVPCDLYINGEYRGSYNLTEKVGLHNNSVDLDDDSRATLLELDTYYDEPHRFHSTELGMPVNIHTPDFDDEASTSALTEDNVRRAYNTLEQKTLDNSVADYMDPLYCANFFLVNSLVNNCELGHPKSTFLYNEDIFNIKESPWVWGPVWDLDWGFGYKENSIYFVDDIEEDFIEHLKNSGQVHGAMGRWVESMFNDPEVKAAYNSLLEYYVNGGGLADVLDFCTAYYAFTASSFAHNKTNDNATSSHDKTDYAAQLPQCLEWLKARAYFLANQAGIKRQQPVSARESQPRDALQRLRRQRAGNRDDPTDRQHVHLRPQRHQQSRQPAAPALDLRHQQSPSGQRKAEPVTQPHRLADDQHRRRGKRRRLRRNVSERPRHAARVRRRARADDSCRCGGRLADGDERGRNFAEPPEAHQEHIRTLRIEQTRKVNVDGLVVLRMRRHHLEPLGDATMRHGNPDRRRHRNRRGDARNNRAGNAARQQVLSLFAAAAEDERIPALEPHDPRVHQRLLRKQRVDLVLRQRVVTACLAHINQFASRLGSLQQRVIDQTVVDDHIRRLQGLKSLHRDKPGISRPCAHQCHFARKLPTNLRRRQTSRLGGRPPDNIRKDRLFDNRSGENATEADLRSLPFRQRPDRPMAIGANLTQKSALRRSDSFSLIRSEGVDLGLQPDVIGPQFDR